MRRPFQFRLWVTYTLSIRTWAVYGYKCLAWLYDNGRWPWSEDAHAVTLLALAPIVFPYAAAFNDGDMLTLLNIMSYLTGKGSNWRGVNPNVSKQRVEQVIEDSGLRIPQRVNNLDE